MGSHDWYKIRDVEQWHGKRLSPYQRFKWSVWGPIAEFGGWIAIFLTGLFILNIVLSVSLY